MHEKENQLRKGERLSKVSNYWSVQSKIRSIPVCRRAIHCALRESCLILKIGASGRISVPLSESRMTRITQIARILGFPCILRVWSRVGFHSKII